jgi:hypothetical protein
VQIDRCILLCAIAELTLGKVERLMYKISIPWPREQKSCETGKYYFGLFCVRVRFLFIHKFLICVSSISTATLASDHSAPPLGYLIFLERGEFDYHQVCTHKFTPPTGQSQGVGGSRHDSFNTLLLPLVTLIQSACGFRWGICGFDPR